jgi:hypothetical protein
VIALSPYADFSGMGVEGRFRSIRIPVLSVTSPEDLDPYGLVGSAAVRRAPYEHMPPGQKYLLLLSSASHTLLAGKEVPVDGQRGDKPVGRPQAAQAADGEGNQRGGVRGRRRSRGGGGDDNTVSSVQNSSILSGLEVTDVQHVTVAYLDAIIKNDPIAWEWLTRDVNRWLGDTATFSSK